jgi:hypothetical protein
VARAGLTPPRLRTARADDLPALLDLPEQLREHATPGVPWERASGTEAEATFLRILDDEGRAFLVAESDGAVVGDYVRQFQAARSMRPVAPLSLIE